MDEQERIVGKMLRVMRQRGRMKERWYVDGVFSLKMCTKYMQSREVQSMHKP